MFRLIDQSPKLISDNPSSILRGTAELGPSEIARQHLYQPHLGLQDTDCLGNLHRPFNFHDFQEFDAQNRFIGNLTTLTTTVKF
jgi:hypothetical protein